MLRTPVATPCTTHVIVSARVYVPQPKPVRLIGRLPKWVSRRIRSWSLFGPSRASGSTEAPKWPRIWKRNVNETSTPPVINKTDVYTRRPLAHWSPPYWLLCCTPDKNEWWPVRLNGRRQSSRRQDKKKKRLAKSSKQIAAQATSRVFRYDEEGPMKEVLDRLPREPLRHSHFEKTNPTTKKGKILNYKKKEKNWRTEINYR